MSKRCMGCMELFGEDFEVCPHCGYIEGTPADEAIHMEPGTLLYDRYIVGKVLGFGGFGVTYIGWDGRLEQKVAIKEYLPSEFSTRMPGQSTVTIFNGDKSEQFHDGLKNFVEEAKRLAKFQNEAGIVKVFDSFSENETAYIVMEFLDGETLTEYLKRENTLSEDDAVNMLMPVMKSLDVVHKEGILHRDIAPDNIFLTKTGEVKLIDFGASRYATTSHSRSLTVIIKPGYSPEEQYRSKGDQGPHTDVYALAATMYKMITGKTPPDAMERRVKIENKRRDVLELPHKINRNISVNRENALLNALNIRIEDRTPDITAFIQELNANPPVKRRYGKIKKIDIYSWPLWIKIAIPSVLAVLLVFSALLFSGVLFPSLFSDDIVVPEGMVSVPDVEGMSKDDALKLLEEFNLIPSPEGNVTSNYIEAGKIVLQTPIGGSYIEEFGTVFLTISSGNGVISPVNGISVVPYVVWDLQEDALSKFREAGLGEPVIKTKNDDDLEKGKVISQSIESGAKVPEGTQITLVISSGPKPFDMPDVVGKTEKTATDTLKSSGLIVKIEYKEHNSVAKNTVISQSIKSGKDVRKGDEVTLTVSTGRPSTNNNNAQTPNTKTITVFFNANGGKVGLSSKEVTVSSTYGALPHPTRDYYSFAGWYTASGTPVTNSTKVTSSSNHTLVAHWSANPVSDWTSVENVPSGSKIVDTKWTYKKTVTTTSSATSMSGWTQTGSSWEQTGTGTHYYASYPSGFNGSKVYSQSVKSASESTTKKVTVSGASEYKYIYWHWCRGVYTGRDFANYNRQIKDHYTSEFCRFDSFESGTNVPFDVNCNAYWFVNGGVCTDSCWWFKITVYKQTYTEYQKNFTYSKTTTYQSTTDPSGQSGVSNVQKLVKYQRK